MKRILSLVLFLVMLFSVMAIPARAEDPVEVTMLYSDNANYAMKEDWFILKTIEEKTGVRLKLIPVPESDYDVKKQTVINSGDMPDIISKHMPTGEQLTSGLFLPISQYVDKMPNYKAYLEKYNCGANMDLLRAADGEYYFLPVRTNRTLVQDQQWLIRYDIFANNNIPIPTTLDEMAAALKTLKGLYPDSVGLTNRFGTGNLLNGLCNGFDTVAGWGYGNGSTYDAATDSWLFAPTSQNWKDMLAFLHQMYVDGTLDPEWATLDTAVYEQYIVQGKTFVMLDWTGNKVRYNAAGVSNTPDYHVGPIYPLMGYEGSYAIPRRNQFEQTWAIAASVAEKPYFDKFLAFVDWCYTDEAEVLLSFGLEGEMYQKDADGRLSFIDPTNVDYSAQYGLVNNALTVRLHPDVLLSTFTAEEADLFKKIGADGCIKLFNPSVPTDEMEIEEISLMLNSLTDYVNASTTKFVTGEMSLNDWDSFVMECQAKGCDRMIEIINTAWTR